MPIGYEVDFLPVGDSNGDAICVRYGSAQTGYTIHLTDGGYTDTGQDIVDHIRQYYGNPTYIDHVVLTHADQDHASGLKTVLESFKVGTLWMNRPWLYCEEVIKDFHGNWTVDNLRAEIRKKYAILVDLEDIAIRKGIPIKEAFMGAQIGSFHVLSPFRSSYLKLIPDLDRTPQSYAESAADSVGGRIVEALKKAVQKFFETWLDEKLDDNPPPVTASNESSVVQMGVFGDRRVVLTGDAGPQALNEAYYAADYLKLWATPNVFQIPHHGSRRNVTKSVLNKWLGVPLKEGDSTIRGTAICSIGKNKDDYPRKRVQNAFIRRGYKVLSTKDGAIASRHEMAPKPGWGPVTPAPFVSSYEE